MGFFQHYQVFLLVLTKINVFPYVLYNKGVCVCGFLKISIRSKNHIYFDSVSSKEGFDCIKKKKKKKKKKKNLNWVYRPGDICRIQ